MNGYTPNPNHPDWIDFLRWVVEYTYGGDAGLIVDIVEKPHKHGDLYRTYLERGGVER